MIYTGGTTGMPKGVMFKQGEFIDSLLTGRARLGIIPSTPTDLVGLRDLVEDYSRSGPHANLPCCPLMHGTGMWVGAMPALTTGSTVVLLESRSFDADEVWRLTERERVTLLAIVGDPFARPLLRALESREAEGRAVDTSSLRYVFSSGAIWSSEIKDGLRSRLSALLVDGLGSTEGLSFGVSGATRDQGAPTAHFILASDSKVVTEDGREVTRGTGEQGILASRTPAYGYYKDPERSARTFFRLEGKGYVLTGDWATVEEDGSVTLLGRGSMTINTGGEKVFAEEVEESIKRHHLVDDCLVVGVPDEQYGQRVVAVIGPSPSGTPTFEEICEFLRPSLAHYKIPKAVVVRERVQRAPNGKADYQWARQAALEGSSIG
jgi:fatty-acyl-CoA synthase